MAKLKKHVFLMGFMGTGKSTIAKEVAKKLGVFALDLDREIEKKCEKSIKQIFNEQGEAHFRKLEQEGLFATMERKPCVVACGGGVVLNPENREFIKKSGLGVVLWGSATTIYGRLEKDRRRPLMENKKSLSEIEKMLAERHDMYNEVADIKISIEGKSPRQICEELVLELPRWGAYR